MGNNDGTLNGKVVFQAKKNHAAFESADKVRLHLKRKDIAGGYKSHYYYPTYYPTLVS